MASKQTCSAVRESLENVCLQIFSGLVKSFVLFFSTSYSILSIPFPYFPVIAITLPPDSAPRSWGDLVILFFILVSESSTSDAGELVAYSASSSAWTLHRMPFGFETWPSSQYRVSWFISQHPTPPLPFSHPNHLAMSVLLLWRWWAWCMKWKKVCEAHIVSCSLVARSVADKPPWHVALIMVH